MKKLLIFLILLFVFGGCTATQPDSLVLENQPQDYQEIVTNLTDQDDDIGLNGKASREKERLSKTGKKFWSSGSVEIAGKSRLYELQQDIECRDGKKETCSITGLLGFEKNFPPEFKKGLCGQNEAWPTWCRINSPDFPQQAVQKMLHLREFYGFGKDIYTVGQIDQKSEYAVYKNNKKLFSASMFFGTESVIQEASMVENSPSFTYYALKTSNGNQEQEIRQNIWYKGETMNEKFDLEKSESLFSYQGKVGFVATKNGKNFIFYNGQKVSGDFDEIRMHHCCAIEAYPFKLHENGVLFFMGKRGEKYIFTEINLKNQTANP